MARIARAADILPTLSAPNVLQKSKKCPIVIKAGLSPVSGNATWSPKEGVATATYFVRAFVMHNSSATVQYQVALGNSQGYFQVRIRSSKGTYSDVAVSMGGNAQAGTVADCHALLVLGQWLPCFRLCACSWWSDLLRAAWLTRCSANCR